MVLVSHTIIDVRAMVIKPLYTPVANVTMPGSGGPHDLTVWAQVQRIGLVQNLLKVDVRISTNVTWVSESGH